MAVRVLGGGSATEVRVLDGLVAWPDVLGSAAWHVDAGWLTEDGNALLDLSGSERHAVFGADAPLVLPWDGENYAAMVIGDGVSSARNLLQTYSYATPRPASNRYWVDYDCRIDEFSDDAYAMLLQGSGGGVRVLLYRDGRLALQIWDASVPTWASVETPAGTVGLGVRHRLHLEWDVDEAWIAVDGVEVARKPVVFDASAPSYFQIGYGQRRWRGAVYGVTIGQDGTALHVFDPSRVDGNNERVPDPAQEETGGYWLVTRADTGFKTAVVDRPAILTSSAPRTTINVADFPTGQQGTALIALRVFGTAQPTHNRPIMNTDASTGGYMLYWGATTATGSWYAYPGGTSAGAWSSGDIGEMVLALAWDGASMQSYLNGAPRVQRAGSPGEVTRTLTLMNDTNGEFLGAAAFDRVLTDDEVALASEALAGRPRMEDRRRTEVREIGTEVEVLVRPTGLVTVVEIPTPPQAPDVTPDETWSRDQMRAWLASVGVVIGDDAYENLSHEELWELVEAVLSP